VDAVGRDADIEDAEAIVAGKRAELSG